MKSAQIGLPPGMRRRQPNRNRYSRPRRLSCQTYRCCWLKVPIPVRSFRAEWESSRPARSRAPPERPRSVVVIAREVSVRCVWITKPTAAANSRAKDGLLVLRCRRFRSARRQAWPRYTVFLSRPCTQVDDLTSLRTKGTPGIALPCRKLATLRTAGRIGFCKGQGLYLLSVVAHVTLAPSCRKPQITLQ